MSTRHVRKWMIAAPIIGFCVVGCGSSNTTFTGLGGAGNGGTSSGGSGGEQGGSGGSSAGTDSGGTGGSGGSGGSSGTAGAAGTAGSGGSGGTAPELGYEPVGVGDPWFFSSATELDAFEVELTGATGEATWNDAGEVHLPLTFTAAEQQALVHFTAPWDAVASSHDPMDLTHRVLKARVKIASLATATGGVQGYSQSSAGWTWVSGEWNGFADLGSWKDVEFDFDTAAAPGEVLRFGLQVYATGAGNAELIIDDLRLEPKVVEPQPDGGVPEGDGGVEPPPVDGGAGDPDAGGGEPDAGGGGLGYEPVGIGDPWFFDAAPEMTAFEFAGASGGAESHSWSGGEIHLTGTFAESGDAAQMYFTTPYDGVLERNHADLTGRVLKARVKVAAGATAGAGVQIFAQSNAWGDWNTGSWNGIDQLGAYTDVTLDLATITNPGDVQRFGVQLYGTSAGSVELIIDDLRLEPAP